MKALALTPKTPTMSSCTLTHVHWNTHRHSLMHELPGLPVHAAAGVGVASRVHFAHGSALEITAALIAPCATCTLAILSCFLATRCFASEPEAALGISERKIEVEVKSLASVRIHTLYGQSAAGSERR